MQLGDTAHIVGFAGLYALRGQVSQTDIGAHPHSADVTQRLRDRRFAFAFARNATSKA